MIDGELEKKLAENTAAIKAQTEALKLLLSRDPSKEFVYTEGFIGSPVVQDSYPTVDAKVIPIIATTVLNTAFGAIANTGIDSRLVRVSLSGRNIAALTNQMTGVVLGVDVCKNSKFLKGTFQTLIVRPQFFINATNNNLATGDITSAVFVVYSGSFPIRHRYIRCRLLNPDLITDSSTTVATTFNASTPLGIQIEFYGN